MIRFLAIDKNTGETIDISDDLYFFEENFIRNINESGPHDQYTFKVFVKGVQVYPPLAD
jgi:hypothetical protein